MNELKPCPFCGEEIMMLSGDGRWYHPVCTNSDCGCEWKYYYFDRVDAVKAWNTRINGVFKYE